MRLKTVYISNYKNIRDFKLSFDGASFIDVFVGKNGSGKSNLFEALVEIFRHLFELDKGNSEIGFDYSVSYEIDGQDTAIEWKAGQLSVNGSPRRTFGSTPAPDNVLIYYSGHNNTVASLVADYEGSFRKRIRSAHLDESRRFFGIGQDYKSLLLSVLLSQPIGNKAREFICTKLGIEKLGIRKPGLDELTQPVIKLALKRPDYAEGKREFDIELNDDTDRYWKVDGVAKDFLNRLANCIVRAPGNLTVSEGYFASDDQYIHYIDIALLQHEFADASAQELFRQFDNLKILGMLDDISVPLQLINGADATVSHFSDGQFQSVYIYAVVEMFKDRNCLTLLDEPDAFLHPEWQFEFLKQVFELTGTAAQHNHVLMCSHSAVTLIPHDKKKIRFFDLKDNQVHCFELPKKVAIKKLSADLIRYSEQEQLLSIINAIQIENKPVLFTEGSTDPIILKEAWYKLFDEEMPFIPFYAFSCTYINQLVTDNRIHGEMNGLPIFALFDFDKAYDQWNGLNGDVLVSDPMRGMIKKWAHGESYALMLPVPQHADIQKQVIRDARTSEHFGGASSCEIEHLFYGLPATAEYYHQEPCVGGTKIVFKSDRDKTAFAKEVVPTLDAACFETLRPMFDFVRDKCRGL